MKVYVDELPKGCKCGCPYCYHEIQNTYYCAIQNEYMEFFGDDYLKRQKDCPLKALKDHDRAVKQHAYKKGYNDMRIQYELGNYTKQVREKVGEEIKSAIKEKLVYPDNRVDCPFDNAPYYEDTICDVIDQIQGETNVKD